MDVWDSNTGLMSDSPVLVYITKPFYDVDMWTCLLSTEANVQTNHQLDFGV